MKCYFDYAATSLKKPEVVGKKMFDVVMNNSYGNPGRGAHDYSLNGYRELYQGRNTVAKLFNVPNSSYVGFSLNVTMALNSALKGLLQPGDHVITTVQEHNSVLRPLYQLEKEGVELSFLGCEVPSGKIDYTAFDSLVQKNTKMVVCTHASNVIGNVHDLTKIGEICQKHGLLFVVDAAQTAGSIEIDMQKSHIDVLCFTGHKSLHGPQGVGGVCFSKEEKIRPLIVGGSGVHSKDKEHPADMPTILEAGTPNLPGIAGLNAGIEFLQEQGIKNLHETQQKLANHFYQGISDLSDIKFYGDYQEESERSGIVSFNIKDIPSATIADFLNEEYEIAIRPGLHCAPLIHEAMGTTNQGMLRFSFSHYNTLEEIDYAISSVHEIYKLIERGVEFG